MNVEIVSVVIGAFLGGALSSIGFYFRTRRELKEKVNESLFRLLEIWSLIAMIKVVNSERFNSLLISRIQKKFPHETIGEREKLLIKKGMVRSIPFLTDLNGGSLNGEFLLKYKNSVNELARIYPVLAFELDQNQMLIRFLGVVDKLVSEAPLDDQDKISVDNMRDFMLGNSFEDLELDLIKLSSLSGLKNRKLTKKIIEKKRAKLDSIPGENFDEYINKVIAPAVQAHYDSLGIENPNVDRTSSSNDSIHTLNT